MGGFRQTLPQLDGGLFLTDGGIETTLIFREGLDLPDFAAFPLLGTSPGQAALRRYFHTYASLAERFGAGLVLESATWRANPDWATRLGLDARTTADLNRRAIALLDEVRRDHPEVRQAVISGCLGPRGDGYIAGRAMTDVEAERYHRPQVEVFEDSAADMVTAITMTYAAEAIGIARAAQAVGMPVVLSFTVETDGKLPSGQALAEAIAQVDLATAGYPAYYMINCAHPTHFASVLDEQAPWTRRIRGVRANASRQSHAELNEATELDAGDPVELGGEHAALKARLPELCVLGGCCGTDDRHVGRIAAACAPLFGTSA